MSRFCLIKITKLNLKKLDRITNLFLSSILSAHRNSKTVFWIIIKNACSHKEDIKNKTILIRLIFVICGGLRLTAFCQLCAISFSPIDLRLLAWYNDLGGQPPYNLPCLPLSKNSWSVYHKDPMLPKWSIQRKVPKTLLTRVYRHGIMIVQGARTLSWFLCASTGTPWAFSQCTRGYFCMRLWCRTS